jgi:hypothetical protein
MDKADTFPVDKLVSEVSAAGYDALVQPGGVANPDFLRMDERAVRLVRDFFSAANRSRRSATDRGCWSKRSPKVSTPRKR